MSNDIVQTFELTNFKVWTVKFLKTIQETDLRSTFGRNVKFALSELGADHIEMADPNNFTYSPVPQEEEWRVTLKKVLL